MRPMKQPEDVDWVSGVRWEKKDRDQFLSIHFNYKKGIS